MKITIGIFALMNYRTLLHVEVNKKLEEFEEFNNTPLVLVLMHVRNKY